MSKGLIIVADRCMGCHTCFTVCKEENQVAPNVQWNHVEENQVAPNVQWNHVERVEHEKAGIIDYFRVSCMHCDDPACMKVCPMKAIYKGPNGEVLVDDQKCIGCHMCEKACPYHAPKFADPGKMSYFGDKASIYKGPNGEVLVDDQKCIGCHMCEKACPYHAPKFADPGKMSYFGDKASLSTVGTRPENKRTPGKAEHCTLCVHRTSKGLLPACAAACPAGAIVYVDYTVGTRPENKRTPGKAEHCTLCVHRTSKGLLPACAAACPAGAIVYVDYDNPTPEAIKLIKRAQPINEAAGTHPKVRFVSSHTDFRVLDIKA